MQEHPTIKTPSKSKSSSEEGAQKKVAASKQAPKAPSLQELAVRLDSYRDSEKENSGWLIFYTILAICTGIAMSGGAIPFFLNTTIPQLAFLSNKIVLSCLTVVQIVVWSAIYGQNNSSFINSYHWRKVTNYSAPSYQPTIKSWFPTSSLSEKFFRSTEESLKHEVVKLDEIMKNLAESKEADKEEIAKMQVQQYLLATYGSIDSMKLTEALTELKNIFYTNFINNAKDFTKIQHLSQEDITRLAYTIINKNAPSISSNEYYGHNATRGKNDCRYNSEPTTSNVEVWDENKQSFSKISTAQIAGLNIKGISTINELNEKIEEEAAKEFQAAFTARQKLVAYLIDNIDNIANIANIDNNHFNKRTFGHSYMYTKSDRALLLTNKYHELMRWVDLIADAIGVINAIFVNSAGIAFSAIQLMAFFANMGVNIGIMSSPIVYAPFALSILALGLLAGWNGAHTVTRMKTRKTCNELLLNVLYWWHNPNKFDFRNTENIHSAIATTIAVVISIGFCCFNAITGAVIGDTLFKIFLYHDLTCVTDPSIILNPSITPTTPLGTLLWWLGMILTIPSTGAFLVDAEYDWVSTFTTSIRGMKDYCRNQIKYKITKRQYALFTLSVLFTPLCYMTFNALGIIPAIALFKVALVSLAVPTLYLVFFNIYGTGTRSTREILSILKASSIAILVMLMTFAVSAQVSISTSMSPIWLLVMTQPQLNIWAGLTGFFGIIGFLSMFNGGLSGSVNTKPSEIWSIDIGQNVSVETKEGNSQQQEYSSWRSDGTNNDSYARLVHPNPRTSHGSHK